MYGWAASFDFAQHEKVKAFDLVTRPGCPAQKLQAGRYAGLALKAANGDALAQLVPPVMRRQRDDDSLQRYPMKWIVGLLGHHCCAAVFFASRGRGSGFAGPQAQRPLGGQRSTQSDKRGAFYLFFSLPRSGTWVTMVGRTASGDTDLGGDVSFFGFLTILPLFC